VRGCAPQLPPTTGAAARFASRPERPASRVPASSDGAQPADHSNRHGHKGLIRTTTPATTTPTVPAGRALAAGAGLCGRGKWGSSPAGTSARMWSRLGGCAPGTATSPAVVPAYGSRTGEWWCARKMRFSPAGTSARMWSRLGRCAAETTTFSDVVPVCGGRSGGWWCGCRKSGPPAGTSARVWSRLGRCAAETRTFFGCGLCVDEEPQRAAVSSTRSWEVVPEM
jgi:hypothetical protein